MKVLIITGNLAYPLIKNVVANANVEVIIHIADNTQVAAFLTPRIIIDEIKTHFANQLEEIDMILVPGLIKKGTREITKELGIPTIVSMNPIMVDGTGMCGACRLKVGDEIKFACVDGPEFDGHLVDFDQAMKRSAMYRTEEGRAMLKLQEGDTHHGGCGQCN